MYVPATRDTCFSITIAAGPQPTLLHAGARPRAERLQPGTAQGMEAAFIARTDTPMDARSFQVLEPRAMRATIRCSPRVNRHMLRSDANLYGISMTTPRHHLFVTIFTIAVIAWLIVCLDPRILGKVQLGAMLALAGWAGIASLWFP